MPRFLLPQNSSFKTAPNKGDMARPRTPSNILEMRGSFSKDPARGRARADEPTAFGEVGDCPSRFNVDQRLAWNDIVAKCHNGVLCAADAIALEIASVLLAQFRSDPDMPGAKLARLDSLLARFGMTPADRSKVTAPKQPKENPFAKLVKKGKTA